MKVFRRFVLAMVAGVLACAVNLCVPAAQAANGDQITRFTVDAIVDADGVFDVTMTLDLQFASSGHGPYVWFLTRQSYDADRDRIYTYTNFHVSSPTGAPTQVQTITETNDVQLKIGDPNKTVSGTQTYVVSYTASGLVNPNVTSSNMDEIYWNVIPTGWELPISNVTVTLTGPSDVRRTTCYVGTDFTSPCTSDTSSASTATYTQGSLSPGEGLAVVGGWPVGTYPGATLDLVPAASSGSSHPSYESPFSFNEGGGFWAGGSAVATGLVAWLIARLRKGGRDEQYANVTPGMVPVTGDAVTTKREEIRDAPVEFAPPKGIPPRLVGACAREGTANEDITATIIDLAVRGYIHMDQQAGGDFDFQRTNADPNTLNQVERTIYNGLFADSPIITKAELSSATFYSTYSGFQTLLTREFNAQKWYKANPKTVVATYRAGGLAVAGLGTIASLIVGGFFAVNGLPGIGWLAIPCLVLGIGMFAVAKRMPVRTPVGSAVAIQSLGFKKYLETAEADQIRWEEGQDIFSAYLPYAIAFGCADRWSNLMQELVAQGAPVPQPVWYTGYYAYRYPIWSSIVGSVGNVGTSFSSTVTAHAAQQASTMSHGSSGFSGFSGGGFGGGIGGGGGGSW